MEDVVEIQFTAFKVTNNGNLYYAERTNPTDRYTFKYSYEIDKNQAISDSGYAFKQADELNFGGRSYVISNLDITVYKDVDPVDTIPVSTKLVFATYPTISQDYYYAGYAYDEVGDNDSIQKVLNDKKDAGKFNLIHNDKVVEGAALKYSTVLGQEGSYELTGEFTRKLTPIYKLSSNAVEIGGVTHRYDEENRTLTLSSTLTKDESSTATYTGTATINNIQYTFERTEKGEATTDTLTIGYQKYTLEGSQIEIDGIVYAVDYGTKTLSITSKLNGMLSCDINNKTYTVDDIDDNNKKLKIKTNYETIYLIYMTYTYNEQTDTYNEHKYWGQWNYKVVDKWTNVKVSYGQEGAAVSYLTFSDDEHKYTYDPNTQTITETETTTYDVKVDTDSDGKTEYQVWTKDTSPQQVGRLVRTSSVKIDFFDDVEKSDSDVEYTYDLIAQTVTNGTTTYDVKVDTDSDGKPEYQVWTKPESGASEQVGKFVPYNESIKIDFFDDVEKSDSDVEYTYDPNTPTITETKTTTYVVKVVKVVTSASDETTEYQVLEKETKVGKLVRTSEGVKIDFETEPDVELSEQKKIDTAWAKVVKLVDHSGDAHSLQSAIAGGLIDIVVKSDGAALEEGEDVKVSGDNLLNNIMTVEITYTSTYYYEKDIEFEEDDDICITTETSAQKTKTLQYAGENIKVIFKSIFENIPEEKTSSAS